MKIGMPDIDQPAGEKRRKRIGAALLAAALLLAALPGCGAPVSRSRLLYPGASFSSPAVDSADRRTARGTWTPVCPQIREDAWPAFLTAADNWVDRPLEEFFLLDEALAMAEEFPVETGNWGEPICPLEEVPDQAMIAGRIRANNAVVPLEKGQSLPPEALVDRAAALAAEDLARWLPRLGEEDRRRIYGNLASLRLLCFDEEAEVETGVYAYVTSDLCLLLSPGRIAGLEGPDALDKTIFHELQHVFQRASAGVNGSGTRSIGPSRLWPELTVNSLWWTWCHEAAAESHVMEVFGGQQPLVYGGSVVWLRLWELAALPQKGHTGDDLTLAAISQNPAAYLDALGLEGEEERRWGLWMLYAVECVENSRLDFQAAYRWKTGGEADWEEVKDTLAASAALGAARLFYRSLAWRAAEEDMPMEDVFFLITLFEAGANRCLSGEGGEPYGGSVRLLEEYAVLQDSFFALLSGGGEDWGPIFDAYALVREEADRFRGNWELSWLEEGARARLEQRLQVVLPWLTISVRSALEKSAA